MANSFLNTADALFKGRGGRCFERGEAFRAGVRARMREKHEAGAQRKGETARARAEAAKQRREQQGE